MVRCTRRAGIIVAWSLMIFAIFGSPALAPAAEDMASLSVVDEQGQAHLVTSADLARLPARR